MQLRGLVDEVSRPVQAAGTQANVTLSTDVDGAVTVRADPHRLGQAIGVLVANAVKFTPAGTCKTIVEAHGGKVVAQSAGPGLGSTFTISLPG